MKVKQLSIFVENQPGRLAQLAKTLGDAGINIMAMTIAETREFGVVRMIVADIDKAIAALKSGGVTVTTTDILAIEVDDKPGALGKALDAFVKKDLNIEYMYAFVAKRGTGAILVFRFDDMDKAIAALKGSEVKVLTFEEVVALQK